jgi:hypothetical protein
MCSVWISEQTDYFPIQHEPVFAIARLCVYCACSTDGIMARVRSRTSACEICGVQGCTGTGFSPALSFPCQYKPPSLHVALNRRTNRQSVGPFHRAVFLRQSESIGCTSKYMDAFLLKSYWGICRIMTYGGVEVWGVKFKPWPLNGGRNERGSDSVAPSAVGRYRVEKNHVAF